MSNREVGPLQHEAQGLFSPLTHTLFLLFYLRNHIRKVSEKVESFGSGDRGSVQLSRYLGLVDRTLKAVEREVEEKRRQKESQEEPTRPGN